MAGFPNDLPRAAEPSQLFLSLSPDAVLLVDPGIDGRSAATIIDGNAAACRLYGYAHEELIGRPLELLVGSRGLNEPFAAVREQGTARVEAVYRRRDGQTLIVEQALSRIPDVDRELILVVVRDITPYHRTERRLAAQHAISRVLAEAGHFNVAAPHMLHILGEYLGWELGMLWCVDRNADVLRFTTSWQRSGVDVADFVAASRGSSFARGAGLPGQVWTSGSPEWVDDIRIVADTERDALAARVGMRSAFAFAIQGRAELFGIMEFYCSDQRPRDQELLEMAGAVGSQTGQYIDRRRAEQALRFQAQLLDAVDQAVIATDNTGKVTYWNRFAEEIYGWSASEALGRNIVDVTPAPAMRDEAAAIMAQLRSGQSWSGEFVVQRRDGTTFPILITDSPVYDESGALVGIVGVSVEITERKRAEDAARFLADASGVLAVSLDDTATLHRLAQMAVPRIADWCAIDVIDQDGAFRRVAIAHSDPAKQELAWEIERRFGFDPNLPAGAAKVLRTGQPELYEEITEPLLAYVTHSPEHLQLLQQLGIRSGMIVPLITRGKTLGSISLGMAESGRRLTSADLDMAEDLANRVALAVDNARLYREAQAAIRLRDEFLSIAAHELKTPVTSVVGYSQLLQRRAARENNTSPRDQRVIEVIVEQSERLSTLVSSLLDVSRLETGQFALNRQPLDVGALLNRISEQIQPMLDRRHTLEVICPTAPVVIEGDTLRLEQVFQNLLQNAIKYSPDGGTITLRLEQQSRHVVVAVSDQGIGIPAAAQAHLFQRFFRASELAHSQISGMGIGLYVVKEIVSRHGGEIEVESTEGKGSTFTVRLPIR